MMAWWQSVPSKGGRRLGVSAFSLMVWLALALVAGTAGPTTAQAEGTPPCPEDNVDACTRYHRLVADMDSGDLVTQLATLRAASQELDPTLQALIFGKALKSSDLQLRTAGLRYVLASRSTLDVRLEQLPHPTAAQQKLLQNWEFLKLTRIQISSDNNEITAVVVGHYPVKANGAVVRGGLQIAWTTCRLDMTVDGADSLKGVLRCEARPEGTAELGAVIQLY